MQRSLEVTFAPAELATLGQRDLRGAVCVVFDVLRATSSMVTALAHGARSIRPVTDIAEALAWRQSHPNVLLAGERGGLRISAPLTGGPDFDLGNSPREFTAERVGGRDLVMTTTNGTRALRACAAAGALRVLPGAFLNLDAVARHLAPHLPPHLLLVGSGTLEQTAFEDTLAAGALADALWPAYGEDAAADSAHIARELYRQFAPRLPASAHFSRNGRRLLARTELRADVPFCFQRDVFPVVLELQADGAVRKST
jgi:2-phosphosulfolactate phosphatase